MTKGTEPGHPKEREIIGIWYISMSSHSLLLSLCSLFISSPFTIDNDVPNKKTECRTTRQIDITRQKEEPEKHLKTPFAIRQGRGGIYPFRAAATCSENSTSPTHRYTPLTPLLPETPLPAIHASAAKKKKEKKTAMHACQIHQSNHMGNMRRSK